MVGDPEGKNTGKEQSTDERVGIVRRSGRKGGGKLNYWEEDSVELMSLHLQGSNI